MDATGRMDADRRIAAVSSLLILVSGAGYLLALLKEMVVAAYFGVSAAMDAYQAALTVPTLINNVLLSTFSAVFIPAFVRCRIADPGRARRIAASTINWLLAILALSSCVLYICAPALIHWGFRGFAPGTAACATRLLRLLSVTVILSGGIGALTGVLNAQQHFFWPACSQMYVTIGSILGVTLLSPYAGIDALAGGLCVGLLAQCVFLIPITSRYGYRHCWSFDLDDPMIRQMLRGAGIYFIAIVAGQVNGAVDMVMASYFCAPGSVAALGYAGKMVQVPIVIFTGALATAVYPFFSAQAAGGRSDEMTRSFARSIRLSAAIFIPLTALLVLLARPLIELLFQRGAFDLTASNLTAAIFSAYVLQLIFYTVAIIAVRAFLALQEMRPLAAVALLGMGLNIVFNLLLVRLIAPPAAGIALATSVAQLVMMCALLAALRRRVGALHAEYVWRGIRKIAAATLAMAAVTFLIMRAAPDVVGSGTRASLLLRTTFAAGGGILAYILCAALMRIEELREAAGMLRACVAGRR
ncbi:MAG: murein biosynthesis integral membrane protein MurJ [Candidatus Aureabacteria bacterium]|nr:murein biosynthesis integral membrane protein MurJ [Candidatus Auribacterota bacterium]